MNGGHAVALKWSLQHVYNIGPEDTWWSASDIGWVVGHSYIVYAPLLTGCTSILFEGKPIGTPDAGTFFRIIEEHNVKALFTAPTAFRAIRKIDPEGKFIKKHNLKTFETLFLAGERLDPDTLRWAEKQLGVAVVDNFWQTESGWPIIASCQGVKDPLPVKAGSSGIAVPGYDIRVLEPETGKEMGPEEEGDICLKLPLPPGTLPYLYNNKELYKEAYLSQHEGFYNTGDYGYIDNDGYVFAMARTGEKAFCVLLVPLYM